MKKIFYYAIILLMAFCVTACVVSPVSKMSGFTSGHGQVFVYLSCFDESEFDVTFTIAGMSFMDKGGVWHDSELEPYIVNSKNLSDNNQLKLKEVYLPKGKYERLKWIISEVSHKTADGKTNLVLADDNEVVINVSFDVFDRESLCLFVEWDLNKSIVDGSVFHPIITAKPQGLEIGNALYVSNEASNCITIIDKQENIVIGTIAVGNAPRGIVADSDNSRLYVANSQSKTISVIDAVANRVITTIDNFGYSPEELSLSSDNRFLYASNPKSNNISVIDTASNIVVNRINAGGENPVGITVDNDRQKIYVANTTSLDISVIDTHSNAMEKTFNISSSHGYPTMCNGLLYVVNDRVIDVYNLDFAPTIVKTMNIGFEPMRLICGLSNRMYAANSSDDEIAFLHTRLGMTTKSIRVGGAPMGMAVDYLRRKLYVANSMSEEISVINLTSEKIEKTIQVGKKPYGIAFIAE